MQSYPRDSLGNFTRLDELLLSAGKTRASISSRIIAFLFSGIFFLAGFGMFYVMTIRPLVNYYESRNWQETSATIIDSKLEWDGDSAKIDISYKYRTGGRNYTGDRYGWTNSGQNFGIEGKRKVTRRFQSQMPVVIWIDPDDPSQSIIDRDITGISGITLLFPVPFLLVGICGLSYAFFGGYAARRTHGMFERLATEADSKGLTSLAAELRDPPASTDRDRKLIFSMAQSKTEGLVLLFATIFWNGIVSVFLCLLVVMIISRESPAIFLGLFLIPFVGIGIFLAIYTLRKLRAPRPPAYAILFSRLSLDPKATEIPVTWMSLGSFATSPDAGNVALRIVRDPARSLTSFFKAKELPYSETQNSLPLKDDRGEGLFSLDPIPTKPGKYKWSGNTVQELSAIFTWEEQPRREERSVTWSLIVPESDG